MKYVVTHHALHTDEGVYRLAFAQQQDDQSLTGHDDIVWDSKDPQWEGKDPETIAAEQREIIKQALQQRQSFQERAVERAESHTNVLPNSIGQVL